MRINSWVISNYLTIAGTKRLVFSSGVKNYFVIGGSREANCTLVFNSFCAQTTSLFVRCWVHFILLVISVDSFTTFHKSFITWFSVPRQLVRLFKLIFLALFMSQIYCFVNHDKFFKFRQNISILLLRRHRLTFLIDKVFQLVRQPSNLLNKNDLWWWNSCKNVCPKTTDTFM